VNKYYIITAFAVVAVLCASIIFTNNTAIGYEQNIQESKSGIEIQQKRQHDLIPRLVDVVEHAAKYEQSTQTEIAKLRTSGQTANVESALAVIHAVAEAYPQLQANQDYLQLMTEMSLSENLIAQYRATYNSDVKSYKTFVRRFPNRLFLNISGYEIQSYEYLEFKDVELPSELFK